MGLGNIPRIWMPLIGILFCVVDGKSENNLVFEAEKIVSAGIEMPYRIAHTDGVGNPSQCDVDNVATTPVYTVMGTSDGIMSVETASDFINELNARGAITRFDIEEGWTHEVTCIQSYTKERLDWVFGHNRNSSGIEKPVTDNKIVKSVQYFSLDGRQLSESPCKGFYIERLIYNDGTVRSFKMLK